MNTAQPQAAGSQKHCFSCLQPTDHPLLQEWTSSDPRLIYRCPECADRLGYGRYDLADSAWREQAEQENDRYLEGEGERKAEEGLYGYELETAEMPADVRRLRLVRQWEIDTQYADLSTDAVSSTEEEDHPF